MAIGSVASDIGLNVKLYSFFCFVVFMSFRVIKKQRNQETKKGDQSEKGRDVPAYLSRGAGSNSCHSDTIQASWSIVLRSIFEGHGLFKEV